MANRKLILLAFIFLFSTGAGQLFAASKVRARRPTPLSDSLRQVRKVPAQAVREAFHKFSQKQGKNWKVRYNPRTALPEALTGGRTARYSGTPEQAAASFFEDNKELLKVEPSALRLSLKKEFMGITHLQYQQYKDGLPIEFSYARVHVSKNGEVSGYQGKFEPEVTLNTSPGISAEAAVMAVIADLGRQIRPSKVELVIYPDENEGALKLAWKIRGRGNGLWVYYINAADGTVLLKYDDLRYYCDNTAYSTYGTSSGTVYAVSPMPGYDPDSMGVAEYTWRQPERKNLRDQYVWVGGWVPGTVSSVTVTNQYGDYCATKAGKMFSSLKGPYFSVSNFRGASAHYDDAAGGPGAWRTFSTPVQTFPYSDLQEFTQTVTVIPVLAANESFAKAMPNFTHFDVGEMDNDGSANDPDYVRVKSVNTTLGAYIGTRTAPFCGASVEDPSYTVTLKADSAGTGDGFTINVSSYLVLNNYTAVANPGGPSSVLWSTSTTGVYLDRSLGDTNALSEVNAFYHLNAIHRYFDGINIDPYNGNVPAADLSQQVPVMVHAHGMPDTITGCGTACPGMRNAFYDLDNDFIMIGDGNMDNANKYRSFALDGTIVRHEYIHLVVNRIYPMVNYGEFGAISEALADYFSLASFWKEGFNGSPGAGANQATLGNFVGAGEGAARDLSASGFPTTIRVMPGDWWGEVHEDGMILSQALYMLKSSTPTTPYDLGTFGPATAFAGQAKADVLTYAALFYFPDNFANFQDAMIDACKQFDTKWGGSCDPSVRTRIESAFTAHNIGSHSNGDSYETSANTVMCGNNNGPECAADISSLSSLSATVYPLGDVDYYSLPLSAGNFTATLSLPGTGTDGIYHAFSMFIFDSNREYIIEASPVIYGTGSDACDSTLPDCKTLSPTVTLNYTVPYGGGRYYLVVSASPNEYYGNSADNTQTPYTLTLARAPQGSAGARLYLASFDNDEIAFDVPYPAFAMEHWPSSAPAAGIVPPPGAELVFEYAQLRDHNYDPILLTRTNGGTGTYMLNVPTALNYTNTDAQDRPLLSGRVKLQPGFARRYPGVGTVYLEVFGRNHMGQVLSLGVSNPLNLSASGASAEAYNNIIGGANGKALFRYSVSGSGTVSIKIYTQSGALVKTLSDPVSCGGAACTGSKEWDGTNSNGGKAASGIYFVKVKGPGLNKLVKVAVVR
jgi:Zn-dependent metalloprotease